MTAPLRLIDRARCLMPGCPSFHAEDFTPDQVGKGVFEAAVHRGRPYLSGLVAWRAGHEHGHCLARQLRPPPGPGGPRAAIAGNFAAGTCSRPDAGTGLAGGTRGNAAAALGPDVPTWDPWPSDVSH
jgi:hypothetical protein